MNAEKVDTEEDESAMVLTLREWRERRGWSAVSLAARAGVARQTVGRVEYEGWAWGRRCNSETIWRLASALGIDFWQFDEPALERDDMDRDEWFPPDDPEPDVPAEEAAPLAVWMRARNVTASKLTHETGRQVPRQCAGERGHRWTEMKWHSGIRYGLLKDLFAGKPVKPTRTEVARICRRLEVQPMQVTEFRALPPAVRAPVRLDVVFPISYRDLVRMGLVWAATP